MPTSLKALILILTLVTLGTATSYAQSDNCDGSEALTLFPRPSMDEPAFGDTIFFDIEFSALDDVEFFQLPVTYDPLLLTYLEDECRETAVLSGFTCADNVFNTQPGQIRIFWLHPDGASDDIFNNDPIVTLAFVITGVAANVTPITIPNSIDGFETMIGNSDPDAPNEIGVGDFCQIFPEVTFGCTEVIPFIQPCGGDSPGSASINVQICGGVAPYDYLLQESGGMIIAQDALNSDQDRVVLENLDPGISYDLVITDSNGDEVFSDQIPIPVEEIISVSVDFMNPNLAGVNGVLCAEGPQSTATLLAEVTPSTSDYVFVWENSRSEVVGSSSEAEDLGPGNYFLTVTNTNTGCSATSDFEILRPDPIVITVDNISGPGCDEMDSQGSVTLTVTGGRPEADGVLGQYQLEFTTPGAVSEIILTRPDGTITWPEDDVDFNAGTQWTVVADDEAAGFPGQCSSAVVQLSVPTTTTFEFDVQDTIVQCGDGLADISFFVTPSPADPPPSFQPNIIVFDENGDELILANNQILRTGDIITDVPPGIYTFEYTNLTDGCVGEGGFTVVDAASISVDESSLVPDNPDCGTVGSVNILINGGTGPFSFEWQDGSTDGPIRTDLQEGIEYFVTITDTAPGSCGVFLNNDAIVVSGSFTFPTQQLTGEIDCDATTGSIVFTREAGDTEDYFLDLGDGSGPVNDTRIDNLPAGTYNVQLGLADNPACVSDPIQINLAPSSGFDLTNLVIDSLHCNFTTGTIDLLGQPSANPPFLLTLTDMAGTIIDEDPFSIEDIEPGTYNVSIVDVTDPNGCPTEVNNITIYDQFVVDLATATTDNIVQPSCGGPSVGTLEIGVTGGIAPYTFDWDDNVITQSPVRDLDPGITYSVIISDATGTCMETISDLVVESISNLAVTAADLDITSVDCSGALGSIGFIPDDNDPNQYILEVDGVQSMPGEPISDLVIGTYDVMLSIAGAPECNVAIMGVEIEASNSLALDESNVTIVPDCSTFESTLVIDPGAVTGQLTIVLFQGNTELDRVEGGGLSLDNVVFGMYRLNVSNGTCETDIPIEIDIDPIELRNVTENGPACIGPGDDGSIELDLDSGDTDFTLEWDDGFTSMDLIRTDLGPGTFAVTVTNGSGCTTVVSDITLNLELTDPFPEIIDEVAASCRAVANGVIEFDNPGGVNEFLWDDGVMGARREDLEGDRGYIITRTIAGNTACSQNFMIEEINTLSDVFVSSADIITTPANCAGGTGLVEIPPSIIQNGDAPFSNFILIGLEGEFLNDTIIGDDNGIFMDVPGGLAFSFQVEDANGCVGLNAVRLEDGDPITPGDIELISEPICLGDTNGSRSIEVTGGSTGMFDIEWSSGESEQGVDSSTASELSSGDQFVIITDNVCGADTIDFVVAEGDSVSIRMDNTQITDATCFGDADGTVLVSVLGDADDFTFSWAERPNMDTNRLTDLEAGIYNLTIVEDSNGCPSSPLQFEVSEPEEVVATLDETTSVAISCRTPEGTINIDVTGGDGDYTFDWVGFPDLDSASESQLEPGLYEISITDGQGCQGQLITELQSLEDIFFFVSEFDPIQCAGETTFLGVEMVSGGAPPYRYSIVEGGNLIDVDEQIEVGAGTYIFNVFDSDGCPARNTTTEEVTEPDPPLIFLGQDTTVELGQDFDLIPEILASVGIDSVNYGSTEPISFRPISDNGISIEPDRDIDIFATLVDEDGCTATDQVTVSVRSNRNVYIPNIFYPTLNGNRELNDNANSFFTVQLGISAEQVNDIQIFDRWGNLMHSGTGRWDGVAPNGQDALPGVYAYLVSVLFKDGQILNFSGDVTLIR